MKKYRKKVIGYKKPHFLKLIKSLQIQIQIIR
jgi:hypothetical protein